MCLDTAGTDGLLCTTLFRDGWVIVYSLQGRMGYCVLFAGTDGFAGPATFHGDYKNFLPFKMRELTPH